MFLVSRIIVNLHSIQYASSIITIQYIFASNRTYIREDNIYRVTMNCINSFCLPFYCVNMEVGRGVKTFHRKNSYCSKTRSGVIQLDQPTTLQTCSKIVVTLSNMYSSKQAPSNLPYINRSDRFIHAFFSGSKLPI